jgi:hypothetical protein
MNKSVNRSLDEFSNSEVVSVARANPLALSLIGLGVGLLLMNGYKKKSTTYRYADRDTRGHQGKGAYASGGSSYSGNRSGNQPSMLKSAQGKITDTASTAYESVGNAASGAYDSVSNVAGTAYSGVTSAATTAVSGVTGAASSVGDYAGKAYDRVGDLGSQARDHYDYYIEENPLAVGAVALALGAAVGMAIPSTRVENQLMGETREQLMQKAQDTAGDLVDRVKQVAGEAQRTISDEVKTQTQNLTQ